MDNSRIPKYWMENSMAEDLWEEHDWVGKTSGGPSLWLLNIRGWGRLARNSDIWRLTTEETKD
jgi:hypothetical protein